MKSTLLGTAISSILLGAALASGSPQYDRLTEPGVTPLFQCWSASGRTVLTVMPGRPVPSFEIVQDGSRILRYGTLNVNCTQQSAPSCHLLTTRGPVADIHLYEFGVAAYGNMYYVKDRQQYNVSVSCTQNIRQDEVIPESTTFEGG